MRRPALDCAPPAARHAVDSAADTLKSKFPRLKPLGAMPPGSHLALGAEEGTSRGALVSGSAVRTYTMFHYVSHCVMYDSYLNPCSLNVHYMMRDAISP